MKFSITQADDPFIEEHNITAEKCVVLNLNDNDIGYAAWDRKDSCYIIRVYECETEDERLFDALMRAVAFEGTKHFIRYVLCNADSETEKKRLERSIFKDVSDLKEQNIRSLIPGPGAMYVDILECFSKHSCEAGHAE